MYLASIGSQLAERKGRVLFKKSKQNPLATSPEEETVSQALLVTTGLFQATKVSSETGGSW